MAIVKTDFELREIRLIVSPTADITDVNLVVSYNLKDDVTGEVLTSVGKGKSVWAELTPAQQAQMDVLGKRLRVLAATF